MQVATAEIAFLGPDLRLDRNSISRPQGRHASTDRFNAARELVAENLRQGGTAKAVWRCRGPDGTLCELVEIGPADAAIGRAYENVIIRQCAWRAHIIDPKIVLGVKPHGLQRSLLSCGMIWRGIMPVARQVPLRA
jgi:hypothetical protein